MEMNQGDGHLLSTAPGPTVIPVVLAPDPVPAATASPARGAAAAAGQVAAGQAGAGPDAPPLPLVASIPPPSTGASSTGAIGCQPASRHGDSPACVGAGGRCGAYPSPSLC
jgi:hypothetical protein